MWGLWYIFSLYVPLAYIVNKTCFSLSPFVSLSFSIRPPRLAPLPACRSCSIYSSCCASFFVYLFDSHFSLSWMSLIPFQKMIFFFLALLLFLSDTFLSTIFSSSMSSSDSSWFSTFFVLINAWHFGFNPFMTHSATFLIEELNCSFTLYLMLSTSDAWASTSMSSWCISLILLQRWELNFSFLNL